EVATREKSFCDFERWLFGKGFYFKNVIGSGLLIVLDITIPCIRIRRFNTERDKRLMFGHKIKRLQANFCKPFFVENDMIGRSADQRASRIELVKLKRNVGDTRRSIFSRWFAKNVLPLN